ncbi:MAG: DUF3143 domain-containing protein [Cyanobacteria bacterium REEB459]|nr:DUF3143 domain-containing protein [Cyanobacteria bacterium REEB459]
MVLPSPDTPLYNHPLPDIEIWLQRQGCEQDQEVPHCWHISRPLWRADISLDTDSLVVRYINAGADGQDVQRVFKYSLSRQDLQAAIFSGP